MSNNSEIITMFEKKVSIFRVGWGDEDPKSRNINTDSNKDATFCIDLKNEMPFPVIQRFVELLPTDSLREFTFTSKENYISGLKYRGIPCFKLYMSKNEWNYGRVDIYRPGKLIIYIEDQFFVDPIFKFLKLDILSVENNKIGINIPRIYPTLEFYPEKTERLEEHLHPGVKNLAINSLDISTSEKFNKIFGIIKRSNVINVLIEMEYDEIPIKAEVIELMGWIKKVNMNAFIACEYWVNLGSTYKRRFIYWYKDDFYLQDTVCNDIDEYAERFCNEIPLTNDN